MATPHHIKVQRLIDRMIKLGLVDPRDKIRNVFGVRNWLLALNKATGAKWSVGEGKLPEGAHQLDYVSGGASFFFSSSAGWLNIRVLQNKDGKKLHPVLVWEINRPRMERIRGSHVKPTAVPPDAFASPERLMPYIKDPSFKKIFAEAPVPRFWISDPVRAIKESFKPKVWHHALEKSTGKQWNSLVRPTKLAPGFVGLTYSFWPKGPTREYFDVDVILSPREPMYATTKFRWNVGEDRGKERKVVPLDALVGPNRMKEYLTGSYLKELFSRSIFSKVVRLAHDRPDLRKYLLPILQG